MPATLFDRRWCAGVASRLLLANPWQAQLA
jgi:hypothetical protein